MFKRYVSTFLHIVRSRHTQSKVEIVTANHDSNIIVCIIVADSSGITGIDVIVVICIVAVNVCINL